MKTFKLFIAIFALTLVSNISNAGTGINQVVIRESSKQMINIKSSLESDETMRVLITRDNKEVILEDEINYTSGLVSKTYDFNQARFGDYFVEVYINDELIKATVIGKEEVKIQDYFILEVY